MDLTGTVISCPFKHGGWPNTDLLSPGAPSWGSWRLQLGTTSYNFWLGPSDFYTLGFPVGQDCCHTCFFSRWFLSVFQHPSRWFLPRSAPLACGNHHPYGTFDTMCWLPLQPLLLSPLPSWKFGHSLWLMSLLQNRHTAPVHVFPMCSRFFNISWILSPFGLKQVSCGGEISFPTLLGGAA